MRGRAGCADNAGLVLDHGLVRDPAWRDLDDKQHTSRWLDQVCQAAEDAAGAEVYGAAYRRREASFTLLARSGVAGLTRTTVHLERVVVGHGGTSPKEFGLTLARPYGLPVLPGAAQKGLAAAWVRGALADQPEWSVVRDDDGQIVDAGPAYRELFGVPGAEPEQALAGGVAFHDAWWVPGSAARPVFRSVATPHAPTFYRTWMQRGVEIERDGTARTELVAPTEWENPVPVAFLAARGGFRVVCTGPSDWAGLAVQLVRNGLRDLGIGGKTSSGYGTLGEPLVAAPVEAPREEIGRNAAWGDDPKGWLRKKLSRGSLKHRRGELPDGVLDALRYLLSQTDMDGRMQVQDSVLLALSTSNSRIRDACWERLLPAFREFGL